MCFTLFINLKYSCFSLRNPVITFVANKIKLLNTLLSVFLDYCSINDLKKELFVLLVYQLHNSYSSTDAIVTRLGRCTVGEATV